MFRDLRYAARVLFQAKGWTVVVVLSLALGIGANTALFSVMNALLLTRLPVTDPDTLVRFRYVGRNDMVTNSSGYGFLNKSPDGQDVRASFSFPMFQQFVADNRTLVDLFACAPFGRVNVAVDDQVEVATAFIATGNYYRVLGVRARPGRTILPDDDRPTATPVATISSKYWHSRFGTDPAIVGKVVRINDVAVTIVGVIASGFTGVQQPLSEPPDITIPLALDSQLSANTSSGPPRLAQPTNWWLQVMGRLKPGVSIAQVQGNLEGVFRHTARTGFESYLKELSGEERATADHRNRTEVPRLRIESGARGVYDVNTNELRSLTILSVVVLLVLLIVCANVANLQLSRATTRQKELSIRLSLGATRPRLIRQLLTESLLLASMGGALGIAVGYWGKQLLPGPPGQPLPRFDLPVLAFVLATTCVTGILFGIAPALRGTRMSVSSALKETSRSVVGSRSILGKSLLIAQVAISLVLLVGAGLFLRTLHNLRHADIGFNPQNLLLLRVNPQSNRYDGERIGTLYRQLMERIANVPGVNGVAMSQPALLSGSVNSTSIYIHGRAYAAASRERDRNSINRVVVSPNFMNVMGIPVVAGRGLTDRDNQSAPKVVVLNQAAVHEFLPNQNPLGQRFGSSLETTGQLEVVGVVRDAKYNSVREAAPPTMYVPAAQTRLGNAVLEVRTAGTPAGTVAAIRDAVRQVDSNLPIVDVSTQLEQIERRFSQERVFALAYTLFGGVALVLAAVGLFGVMSYSVARRTNEIGIRMALGARRQDVVRLVMSESMALVVGGIAIGVAIALAASQLVAKLLFGLSPTDILSIATAVLVMICVSIVAAYLPARRASRVDPMVALHAE
jgi:predicted permease